MSFISEEELKDVIETFIKRHNQMAKPLVAPTRKPLLAKFDMVLKGLKIKVDFPLLALSVIRTLDQIVEWRGQPTVLLQQWTEILQLRFSRLGWGMQRGMCIERILTGKSY
ncbi:MAG: hypothetical protein Q8L79_03855 [Methylobacter sp.]|uniref:hypothetical protein n=1 Tax=Methylobacter sp. TaxID=2051955 RepID=UPI00273163BE|nr:hypothetical protein [Methylobacter sp.]MDP1664239.1 hypothetical protein [Methylobacter sp.]